MDFVFWQNALSIHQSAFLRNLAEKSKVLLVIENQKNTARKNQGWLQPDYGKVVIQVAPSLNEIKQILNDNKNAFHIFSGFFSIPLVQLASKIAIANNIKIGFILEPFNQDGIKGILRFIKYSVFIKRFKGRISVLFPTGIKASKLYLKAGFPKQKVFNWGYFTEEPVRLKKNNAEPEKKHPSVLYIGQLISRKNIVLLVETMKNLRGNFEKLTIVGIGMQEEQLLESIKNVPEIILAGQVSNQNIGELLYCHDILVLPSKFDGWGAVVNEALQAGTPVIASENCGSTSLLDGETRGEIFHFNDKNNLKTVLVKWLKKGKVSLENRKKIMHWSAQNISGVTATIYFLEIIDFVTGKTIVRPQAPWIKNKF